MLAFNIDFSWFLLRFASQVASKISGFFRIFFDFFEFFCKIGLRWPQEPPKGAPRPPQEHPRPSQDSFKGAKNGLRAPQERRRAVPVRPECTEIHKKFPKPCKNG